MSNITMTSTDPGEGSPLAEDEYIAVYGGTKALDLFYPVGSYYKTTNTSFDPNVAWGGSWQSVQLPYDDNEVVSRFIFDELHDTSKDRSAYAIRTKLGTTLYVGYTNHGSGYYISYGGSTIHRVREFYDINMNTTTNDWGILGIDSATFWTHYQGANNGNYVNTQYSFTPEYDGELQTYYCSILNNAGDKTSTSLYGDFVRVPGRSMWHGFCAGRSSMSGNAANFEIEYTYNNSHQIPGFFQRGAGDAVTNVRVVFEIFEKASTKDYAVWKRTV